MSKQPGITKKAATDDSAPAHDLMLSPVVQGAARIEAWGSGPFGKADLSALIVGLRERNEQIQAGDMRPVEAMLFDQAVTLDTIFTNLARRAVGQEYLKQFQTHLTLALKAQAQCRATLEALAEIKNPRQVLIAKQANVANGPQQVNNGTVPQSDPTRACAFPSARAEQTKDHQNGLLEDPHGVELDTRAQGTTGRADPQMEAVAAGHRATHA